MKDGDAVRKLMQAHSVVLSAVTYHHNFDLTRAAIDAGAHFCDLGHDDAIVGRQLGLKKNAASAGVTAIANCGLAPGLADILAMEAFRRLESVESLQLRVGGLPQHPRPPLNYQLVFSAEGLLEEYTIPSQVIRNGKIASVSSLTEVESLAFPPPFNELEAFHTGGGTSRLPQLLQGRVQTLEYKTIRYPGHCEKMRTLLDLGFGDAEPVLVGGHMATARELFLELLKKRLTFDGEDVVLLRVTAAGSRNGHPAKAGFEMIDRYDRTAKMTAMMRTTAFPTTVIARMLLDGTIRERGVFTAEEIVPATPLIDALAGRGITIQSS